MFEFETGLIFWTSVSFAIMVALLYLFGLPPVIVMLEKREKHISGTLAELEQKQKAAEKLIQDNHRQLLEGRAQVEKIVALAQADGEGLKKEILEKTRRSAEQLLEQAKVEIEREKGKLIDSVKKETADLVMTATERLLRRTMNAEENRRLTELSLDEGGNEGN